MAQLDPITWFRSAHPEQGSLRVQVSAAQGIFPIPGAAVEVYRDFGAVRETFYSGVTDSSGIADRILLPALPASLGLSSDTAGISGTAYTVAVSHPDYHCLLRTENLSFLPSAPPDTGWLFPVPSRLAPSESLWRSAPHRSALSPEMHNPPDTLSRSSAHLADSSLRSARISEAS